DLTVRATEARVGEPGSALLGALTVLNTKAALVERVVATSGVGRTRAASCVTIRNDDAPSAEAATARIRDCELQVGTNQIGALLVNTPFATVDANQVVRFGPPTRPVTLTRRLLIRNVRFNKDVPVGPPPPRTDVSMFGGALGF